MQIHKIGEYLNGVVVIQAEIFKDTRGFFSEIYREDEFKRLGLPHLFVQENHSGSVKNTLRGLHFQWEPPMAKMMRVIRGEAFLVAVDIRKGSPTFGKWHGEFASEENRKQMFAPASFARGFCVLSDFAEIQYLCTNVYNNKAESGILWNDPKIGIEWPIKTDLILSDKDKVAQSLDEWVKKPESDFFKY